MGLPSLRMMASPPGVPLDPMAKWSALPGRGIVIGMLSILICRGGFGIEYATGFPNPHRGDLAPLNGSAGTAGHRAHFGTRSGPELPPTIPPTIAPGHSAASCRAIASGANTARASDQSNDS